MKKNQKGRLYRRFFTAAGSMYHFIISLLCCPLKMQNLGILVLKAVVSLRENSVFDKNSAVFYHF